MANKLQKWGTCFLSWMLEGKVGIMCILVLIAVFSLSLGAWCTEASIRWAGFVLQLLGMCFAIKGVLDIRKHFKQEPLRMLFFEWLKRFPKWNENKVETVGIVNAVEATDSIKVEIWTDDNPHDPIEKRIESIIRNQNRLKDQQNESLQAIDSLKSSHEAHKNYVLKQQEQMKENGRVELESIHINGIILSLVGLTWITIGIAMSTISPELTQWICSS